MRTFLFLVGFLIFGVAQGQVTTTQMAKNLSNDEENGIYELPELKFKVLSDGTITDSLKRKVAKLEVEESFFIEKLFYLVKNNDLIILANFSNSDEGYSSVEKVDLKSKKVIWTTNLPGFNLFEGVAEHNYLYAGVIGLAAKIDLRDGTIVWKHDNLYNRYKCNHFKNIVVKDKTVDFVGISPVLGKDRILYNELLYFTFNKITGEMITFKKSSGGNKQPTVIYQKKKPTNIIQQKNIEVTPKPVK